MRLDAAGPVLTGLILVLVAALVLGLIWDRAKLYARIGVAAISLLAVVATSALELNRLTEAYPTWSDLAGAAPASDPAAAPSANPAQQARVPIARPLGQGAGTGGRIVELTIAGRASGMTMPAYVYLPAAYATGSERFPVIEATHGYPGSPKAWLSRLGAASYLDREIAAGRMAPTVVVFAYQTPITLVDTECTDLVHGPQAETYLTRDVPAAIEARFRVRSTGSGWGLIGFSAGGFCSTNLLLRHPGEYAAAASLSGYAGPGITIGDGSEKTTNNPAWRLRHLRRPAVGLFLGWANDDKHSRRDNLELVRLARAPLAVTTAVVAHGGHSDATWRQMEGPAFDWLSSWLARPAAS
jgi:S-formylglutathione hydrolase FrmB